ncbi:MAG: hypothetical protein FJ091_01155 [Deltaproteobacteria bacterium]|nr:hypothetical protein [Deltaproteobacteria bacterium]
MLSREKDAYGQLVLDHLGGRPGHEIVPDHRRYHRLNRARGRLGGQLRIRVRHRFFATPWFDYWLASPAELRRALSGTGWRIAALLPPESGVAYGVVMEKERRK